MASYNSGFVKCPFYRRDETKTGSLTCEGVLPGSSLKSHFGTKDALVGDLYFSKNSFSNMRQMYRIAPEVIYNLGKVAFGLEYELTSVQYGDKTKGMNLETGLYDQGLHWVTNNRVQGLVKYTF